MSALSLGVDFLQVVSIFTAFGFKWPAELNGVFTAASTASLNDQLLAPECSVSGWSLTRKWFAVQILPALFVGSLVIMFAVYGLLAKFGTEERRKSFSNKLSSFIGVCIAAVYTLYFSVVKGALSIFNCVVNESGVRVLVAHPSEQCDVVRVFPLVACCCPSLSSYSRSRPMLL
jgi:hypothetical protein